MVWTYQEAFARNFGLINREEQERLRSCRVAIAGQGGVGGVHLVTLARLGIGKFTIADPDCFEVANFNRQYGANASTIGQSKADVMAKVAKDINPEIAIDVWKDPIDANNVERFLKGADLFVDGIDAFEIDVRRIVFRRAAQQGIFSITAGPIGFSTAWIVFDPKGLSFDDYFDLNDRMKPEEKFAAFIAGLVPCATHRTYMDMAAIRVEQKTGPSSVLACQLCAGVAAAEAIKILLKRGGVRSAPYYHQFDAYRGKLVQGRLCWGNRSPLQLYKRKRLREFLIHRSSSAADGPTPG